LARRKENYQNCESDISARVARNGFTLFKAQGKTANKPTEATRTSQNPQIAKRLERAFSDCHTPMLSGKLPRNPASMSRILHPCRLPVSYPTIPRPYPIRPRRLTANHMEHMMTSSPPKLSIEMRSSTADMKDLK
jgi:hypothetical protein